MELPLEKSEAFWRNVTLVPIAAGSARQGDREILFAQELSKTRGHGRDGVYLVCIPIAVGAFEDLVRVTAVANSSTEFVGPPLRSSGVRIFDGGGNPDSFLFINSQIDWLVDDWLSRE
ncbi:hypothetical protein N9406_10270 [Verrucomicrobiales bacterium]|jgi:hypothetical protein|nr:hypothetical protein [Verrucomicrobiales bacterium]MDB3941341.1 hypothetical protein [Verrucomicrobiales bacterium]